MVGCCSRLLGSGLRSFSPQISVRFRSVREEERRFDSASVLGCQSTRVGVSRFLSVSSSAGLSFP